MGQMTAKTVHVTTEGQMPKSIKSTEFPGKIYSDLSKLEWNKICELIEEAYNSFPHSIEILDCNISFRRQTSNLHFSEALDACKDEHVLCTAVVRDGYSNDYLELCISMLGSGPDLFIYVFCPIEEGLALLEKHGAKIIRDTSV